MRTVNIFILTTTLACCGTTYDDTCMFQASSIAGSRFCYCNAPQDCWESPQQRIEELFADYNEKCRDYLISHLVNHCWNFNQLFSRNPGSEDPLEWVNVETGERGRLRCGGREIPESLGIDAGGVCCVETEEDTCCVGTNTCLSL